MKVLCKHQEAASGAEVLITCPRKENTSYQQQMEDLRKFKGNVEKSTAEPSLVKDIMILSLVNNGAFLL